MKISLICAVATASLLVSGLAFAQPSAPTPPAKPTTQPTTHVTKDYTEQTTDGGAVVKFSDDNLPGDPNNPWGDLVKAPPRVTKLLLIRPRMNFLPELYKSVENL